MKNIPIFVIDFEGSKSCGILEFGCVEIIDGNLTSSYTEICKPKKNIDERTQILTKITNLEASKKNPFESYLEFFSQKRSKSIFASHNYQTEDSLLRSYAPSPGLVNDFIIGNMTPNWGSWIDTKIIAKNFNLPSKKLSDIIEELSLKNQLSIYAEKLCPKDRRQWHCALYDAIASALIIIYAYKFADSNMQKFFKVAGFTIDQPSLL